VILDYMMPGDALDLFEDLEAHLRSLGTR
jgi:hypothetical protein